MTKTQRERVRLAQFAERAEAESLDGFRRCRGGAVEMAARCVACLICAAWFAEPRTVWIFVFVLAHAAFFGLLTVVYVPLVVFWAESHRRVAGRWPWTHRP